MHPHVPAGGNGAGLVRWRLALLCAGYLLFAFPLVLVAYRGLPIANGPSFMLATSIGVAIVLLSLTHVLMHFEGRRLSDFGLSWSFLAAKHLMVGLVAGALVFGAGSLVVRLALPFVWQRSRPVLPIAILSALLFHLITNACEELAWRGYAFEGLLRVFGHWPAQMIVALTAAYFHVLSGWSWPIALTSTTAGSVLFALVFLRWSSIPAAIGVHAGWNWTRDLIFAPVTTVSVLRPTGTQEWTRVQWNIAQAIFIGVSLVACAWLIRSSRRASLRSPSNKAEIAAPLHPV